MRVGIGYDIHRLIIGRSLVLGGVSIAYEKGLLGHSDADVLTHAICDALLGAAGLGDIGTHFPDSDPQYKDISSLKLLSETCRLLIDKGFRIVNLDATVFAEALKRAWLAFFDENMKVDLDPNNLLEGRYIGELRCKVAWGEGNELSVKLDSPRMVRSSKDSKDWELAPEVKKKIEDLQNQLLKPS